MSRQPRTVLVLGGIRSGKSEFAESLVADAAYVRYVATATEPAGDPEWTARDRRPPRPPPGSWSTDEIGKSPEDLAGLIAGASRERHASWSTTSAAGWPRCWTWRSTQSPAITGTAARGAGDLAATVGALAHAVAATPARVVFVTPEVGMSIIPATPLGRTFADACGSANRALAEACDGVVLIVAGQPTWIKATAARLPSRSSGHAQDRGAAQHGRTGDDV